MAYFARVDNGTVQQVIAVANEALDGLPFPESEPVGQAMLAKSGFTGEWLQCSYNNNFRGVYPGIGYTWDGSTFAEPGVPSA